MSSKISSISNRMKKAMDMRNINQAELCRRTGIGKSSISTYLSGDYEPKQTNLYKIAEALDVSIPWLNGYDVNMEKNTEERPLPSNLIPITKVNRIPVVGTIAAGKPITATENIESYIMLDQEYKADFALKIKGDSMIDAGINDGDLALIIKDKPIINGDIYAVLVDGDATLKKVYKNDDYLTLQPCNSRYEPLMVKQDDEPYIVGKLSGIVRKY
ncbi:LexA family protein [Peptoniphilus asaccharolyticus]